jgi:hypothetical protein
MATYSKQKLSGSTDGLGILLNGTSGSGATTIHTAVSGTSDWDEIYIYATNNDSSVCLLTIEFGGVSSPKDQIVLGLESQSGLILVLPGLILQNGAVLKGYGGVASKISIFGFVNRITT